MAKYNLAKYFDINVQTLAKYYRI